MVELRKFGDFATFKYGKMPDKKKLKENGKYPVYSGYRYVGYYEEFNTEANQIIVVARGVGGTGDVKLTKEKCYLTNLSISANIDESIALPEFIYYYYLPHNLRYLDSGSAQSQITISDLEKVMIPLPSLDEQRAICGYMRMLDRKIEINSEVNKNLLQQAQALFISWFVNYEPFGGIMPEDWKAISVYNLADYINGAAFKKNEYSDTGVPIIKIAELKNGITDSTQRCCVKKDDKYYIDDRDVLFSWSGNPDTSIDTFIWSMGRAILNQHTFRVVSKYDAPAFTFFLLKYLKPQFTHIASNKQTTGLGHVTVADLKRLQFSAKASVISEFNTLVMPMFDLIYSNYKEIQQLSVLRDALLPQLMSGELDVSTLDL